MVLSFAFFKKQSPWSLFLTGANIRSWCSVASAADAKLGMKHALSTVLPVNTLFHFITDGMLQGGYFYPHFMAEEQRLQKVHNLAKFTPN